METKTVSAEVIGRNRKALNVLGANLGSCYFQAETRGAWAGFEQASLDARADKLSIMITREPKRYRITDHNILNVATGVDAVGSPKVFLNKGQKDEVSFPIGANMEHIGVVVDDAIGKALNGDTTIIFSDGEKLCNVINSYNVDEKNRLLALREQIDKMINIIDQDIAINKKKVNDYRHEVVTSAPQGVPVHPGTGGIIISATTEE